MIGTVVLDWDDAVRTDSAEPAALASHLRRLSALGVDVILTGPGMAGGAGMAGEGTGGAGMAGEGTGGAGNVGDFGDGRAGPGRLIRHSGAPDEVVDQMRRQALENGEPERIVLVNRGELESFSPRRVLAELEDVADALAAFPEPVSDASWRLEVDGFDAAKERDVESWLTVGNGRTGTRGSIEEGSSAAVYVAGVYGRPSRSGTSERAAVPDLVRGPQWTHLAPRVGDQAVELDPAESAHRRVLDLRQGIVFREWRQRLPSGHEWTFRSARFASMADRRLLALEAEAGAGGSLAVSMASGIPVPPGQEAVESVETGADGDETVVMVKAKGGGSARFVVSTHERDGTVERLAAVERQVLHVHEEGARAALVEARAAGMAGVRARHRRAWRDRWHDADVVVRGDAHTQRALRFALYHLISAGDPESDIASVGARGLTGPGYKGHAFWDTEVFVLPFLVWTHPPTARALLAYRHRTLPAARAKASRLGWSGALYAWESADTGEEATPPSILLPDGTRLDIHTDVQEHHISGDIAWGVWQYWLVTADQAFLVDMGAEILLETARFWASRVTPGDDGRFHIRKVIGPDEYHEGVDDNAFTNVLARWNLETAAEVCGLLADLDPSGWRALAARLDLGSSEPGRWREVASGLVDGFDPATLLYEQFAGFFGLDNVRAVDLAPRPFTAELVVGVDRLPKTQVVKQADVVMLAHMLAGSFPPGAAAANYRYYEPRTCHGSSLSPAMHAAVAARVGALDDADRYFRMAADLDLDDRMGNAAHGVHIATMGGLWQAAVFGFGGVHGGDDALRLDPHLPPAWEGLSFPVQWRGTRVHADIRPDGLTLTLDGPATVVVGTNPPARLDAGRYLARREGDDWSAVETAEGAGAGTGRASRT